MIRLLLVGIIFAWSVLTAVADVYTDYIERYRATAISEQQTTGIPASITLAQGLLESAAGRSTLATRGNNHFGIKCHTTWTGDTLLRSDDAPDECFRAYRTAEESFSDHSRFLQRRRYAPLFELDPTDYAAWARTLRECGYATDPNYSSRLITIIERYALYLYDTDGGRSAEENTMFIQSTLLRSHPVRKSRGLHYVIATPGDTYGDIAREFNIDKKKLLEYNEMRRDGEIRAWEEVYLQEKQDLLPEGIGSVTVGEEETVHSVAQRYGVKMSAVEKRIEKIR